MSAGIIAALVVAFVISFDELAMTIFLVQPGFMTFPVQLYSYVETQTTPIIYAASAILLIVSGAALVIVGKVAGLEYAVSGNRGTSRSVGNP
jgi:putative spermidine/putrescine transport system permease protein